MGLTVPKQPDLTAADQAHEEPQPTLHFAYRPGYQPRASQDLDRVAKALEKIDASFGRIHATLEKIATSLQRLDSEGVKGR